tara:strand:+ start:225 stop:530 length:306 start_codon:yes stop_codon:yes gene_type:complete
MERFPSFLYFNMLAMRWLDSRSQDQAQTPEVLLDPNFVISIAPNMPDCQTDGTSHAFGAHMLSDCILACSITPRYEEYICLKTTAPHQFQEGINNLWWTKI